MSGICRAIRCKEYQGYSAIGFEGASVTSGIVTGHKIEEVKIGSGDQMLLMGLTLLLWAETPIQLTDINSTTNKLLKGHQVAEQDIKISLLSNDEYVADGTFMSLKKDYETSLQYFKEVVIQENKQQATKYVFCNDVGFYVYFLNDEDFAQVVEDLKMHHKNIDSTTSHLSYYNPETYTFASIVCFTCTGKESENFYSYLLRQNCISSKQ